VPLEETVSGFASLVADGTVGLLGVSNHWSWRVERARNLAAAAGLPGYEVLQYHYSYLRHRTDFPERGAPDGQIGVVSGDLLSYVRDDPKLALVAYSPLLSGAYVRADRPLSFRFDHAGTPPRLEALRSVAKETGATPLQVVLSWLIGGSVPVIPLVGASSVTQIEESLAAVELDLTAEQRERLDGAF
jgi:aryl-alcohol dehydrogenase-like predicted oxidoreductase